MRESDELTVARLLMQQARALAVVSGLDLDALRVLQGRLEDAGRIVRAAIKQQLRRQRQAAVQRV